MKNQANCFPDTMSDQSSNQAVSRQTIQKQLVYDVIQGFYASKYHPTADEVYERITLKYPLISKATVYRNLNSLVKKDVIQKIQLPNEGDRFDFNQAPHYHIKCKACGKFSDLKCDYFKSLNSFAQQASGFKNISHSLIFSGYCNKCLENVNNKK